MRVRLSIPTALLVCSSIYARADTFLFNFTPLSNYSTPDDPATFTLNTSQAPSAFGPVFDGDAFYYDNVPVLSNGVTYLREVGFGQFLVNPNGFNISLYEFGVGQNITLNVGEIALGATSPSAGFFNYTAFFSGTLGAPVFIPGVYTYPTDGILTITDQTPTVTPEPSSLVLLGTGVLGVAGVVRRRVARA